MLRLHTICAMVSLAFFVFISSCKNNGDKSDGKIIAKAFDKNLFLDDLLNAMPPKLKGKDSASFASNFINGWVKKQVLIHKAEENITIDQKDFEEKLENYKNSLITYAYERELIRQKLDTNISDLEIEKYYNENKDDFELKENIVKVVYVKVNNSSPKINKVGEWYKLKGPKDREQLESFCYQFADNYFLDDKSWLLFNDLLKEIPIKTYNQEQFLQNNRYIEMKDSLYSYFVNILGFKIKDNLSPLGFEKENIRNIMINKRKMELIDKMQNDLYKEAEKNNEFEIFK